MRRLISLFSSFATVSVFLGKALAQEAHPGCIQANVQLNNPRQYDVIVFGDEVPGVMTAVKVKRELEQKTGTAKVALITEGDTDKGIGGHLVRGGLAYLDRNQSPPGLREELGTFGATSQLYQEFLDVTGTDAVALDRFRAAQAFNYLFWKEQIALIDDVELETVATANQFVCSLTTSHHGSFVASQFIDATQGGKLAEISGVEMAMGFAQLGLPDSSLSVGWVFEAYGSIEQLKQIEAELIERFLDNNDRQAQNWLATATGNDPDQLAYFERSLTNRYGQPATLYQVTPDSADVRSLALSAGYHGCVGTLFNLRKTPAVLDRANVAVLSDRLSINALLFDVSATQARELSHNGSQPTAQMREIADQVATCFQRLGFQRIEFMDELYIRNVGQIAASLDDLTATKMADGGVPAAEALGTFAYHFDFRGGIAGLDEKMADAGIHDIDTFLMPIFNYGFRHTLPVEYQNLAVLGPASGFGGLGTTAGRIVEFNISVGEGLAIAAAIAIAEGRSLHTVTNQEVKQALGYTPRIYGRPTSSWFDVFTVERKLREF
ncbi:MAG: FAD-dependent oxidoreductase [Cyanophyceae cyanobacterium]